MEKDNSFNVEKDRERGDQIYELSEELLIRVSATVMEFFYENKNNNFDLGDCLYAVSEAITYLICGKIGITEAEKYDLISQVIFSLEERKEEISKGFTMMEKRNEKHNDGEAK